MTAAPTPRPHDLALASYDSPIGRLTVAARGEALVGLWVSGQRFFGHPHGIDEAVAASAPPIRTLRANEPLARGRHAGDREGLERAALWLDDYFAGKAPDPATLESAPAGSDFQRRVWAAMSAIPYGGTTTYGQLARQVAQQGQASSARAVGTAVARNPLLLILPCHRVLAATHPGGYAAGRQRKLWLLAHEAATASFVEEHAGTRRSLTSRRGGGRGDAAQPSR